MAQGMKPYLYGINYEVIPYHPKRPDTEQMQMVQYAKDADVIDFQYFKTAQKLMEDFPWLKEKKKILAHHNPYSIHESDWKEFDVVVANNQSIQSELIHRDVRLIPNAVDHQFWTYNENYSPESRRVLMVANRIESKKGILPVATACGDANATLVLVGNISDRQYMDSVMSNGAVEFHENISDEKLRDLYHSSSLHICNSVDNFESGTNPILESMFCGLPVITREVGHVPELNNDSNFIINTHEPEDSYHLMNLINEALSHPIKLNKQRQSAWNSVKARNFVRRAWQYRRLYRELHSEEVPVSVIVPVSNSIDHARKCIDAIRNNTYKNIEIVVVDDSNPMDSKFKQLDADLYINSFNFDYGLARARNIGAIYASSDILVFCDERQVMEENAIVEFVTNLKPKTWLYGNKGSKKDFVENFSCLYRQEFFEFGMFNERITAYGGLSEETRKRFRAQGNETKFIESARAKEAGSSRNRNKKRKETIDTKNQLYMMGWQ